MGRIKNWRKEQGWGTSAFGKDIPADYVNTENGLTTVRVRMNGRVEIFRGGAGPLSRAAKTRKFSTKEKARKWAVKWMRNHPNGL